METAARVATRLRELADLLVDRLDARLGGHGLSWVVPRESTTSRTAARGGVCVASRSRRSGRRRRQIALSFGDGSDEQGEKTRSTSAPAASSFPQGRRDQQHGRRSRLATALEEVKTEPPPLRARGLFLNPSFLSSRALGAPRTNLVVEVLDQTPERHARVRGGPVGRVDARQLRVLADPAREWRLLLSA